MRSATLKKTYVVVFAVALALIAAFSFVHASKAEAVLTRGEIQTQAIGDNGMRVYPIALGNTKGDCVLLESGGEYLLMDLGTPDAYPAVKKELEKLGVSKLSVYLSHFHKDHTGGLQSGEGFEALMKDFSVEHLYLPDKSCDTVIDHSWHYGKAITHFTANGGSEDKVTYLKAGSSFNVGSTSAEVLGPVNTNTLPKPKNAENEDASDTKTWENNCSLTTMFTCGSTKFLVTGDCEVDEEAQLVKKYGSKLQADIFKMGHHGYTSANSEKLMDLVKPKVSFVNSTGDPTSVEEVKKVDDKSSLQNGMQYLGLRKSIASAQKYGIAYITGLEDKSLRIDCDASKNFKLSYLDSPDKIFSGWTRLHDGGGYCVNWKAGQNWKENYLKNSGAGAYGWYYIQPNGTLKTGIAKMSGKLYNFGTGGVVQQGRWVTKNGDGSKVSYNGAVDGFTRFYKQNTLTAAGEMLSGKQKVEGKTYYFNTKTGERMSGIIKIGKKSYMFGKDGVMKTNYGFKQGKYNYYATKSGALAKGWTKIKKKIYYFDNKCHRVNGVVKKISGKYYKFGNDGQLWKNRMFLVGAKRYCASKTGALYANTAKAVKGTTYLFQKNAVAMKGTASGKAVTFKGKKYVVYASGRAVLA